MKFETILDAYEKAAKKCALRDPYIIFPGKSARQRAAFRARLERMYNSMVKDKQMFEDLWKDYDD